MDNHQVANKPEELLDLVDQDDKIIGEVFRKVANSDPKYTHREVGVIIVDNDNRVLLQKRSQYKTVFPGVWSITAGHILKGNDHKETAHVELSEELGFDTSLEFIQKDYHSYSHESHFMYYYIGKYNGEEIKLEKAEVEKVQFLTKEEFEEFVGSDEKFNKNHLAIIQNIFKNNYQEQLNKI